MDDYIEEASDNSSQDRHESAGDGQRHIKGVLYRRQDHSREYCSAAMDPVPTDFLGW